MRNYRIRFSLIGTIAVILVMLPNILYLFVKAPVNVLINNESKYWLWNVLENIGRFGMIISLCAIINKSIRRKSCALDVVMVCSLLIYYALWIIYFLSAYNHLMLVVMAFFPSLFFLLISWKLKNMFSFSFSLLFATTHIFITSSNFLF